MQVQKIIFEYHQKIVFFRVTVFGKRVREKKLLSINPIELSNQLHQHHSDDGIHYQKHQIVTKALPTLEKSFDQFRTISIPEKFDSKNEVDRFLRFSMHTELLICSNIGDAGLGWKTELGGMSYCELSEDDKE